MEAVFKCVTRMHYWGWSPDSVITCWLTTSAEFPKRSRSIAEACRPVNVYWAVVLNAAPNDSCVFVGGYCFWRGGVYFFRSERKGWLEAITWYTVKGQLLYSVYLIPGTNIYFGIPSSAVSAGRCSCTIGSLGVSPFWYPTLHNRHPESLMLWNVMIPKCYSFEPCVTKGLINSMGTQTFPWTCK